MISEIAWFLRGRGHPQRARRNRPGRTCSTGLRRGARHRGARRRGHGRGPFLAGRRARSCGSPRTRNSTAASASGLLAAHEAAARGELAGWIASPYGALALLLLLDQFPRNAFRGTPRMYDTDALARRIASAAIAAGHDRAVPADAQAFHLSAVRPFRRYGRPGPLGCAQPAAWASLISRMPKATATSSGASGASRIATRSWGGPPRRTSNASSTRAASRDSLGRDGARDDGGRLWTRQPREP